MNTANYIHRLAKALDTQGKGGVPIRVMGTREYLRRFFKAKERGGPLFCGEHELILTQPARMTMRHPPQQVDIEEAMDA